MSNAGLSSANFMSGAMQGYNFMQGIDNNKQQQDERKQLMGLRTAQEQRAQEDHTAQVQTNALQQQEMQYRLDHQKNEDQDTMEKALAWSMYNAKGMPDTYKKIIETHPNLDVSKWTSDEAGTHIDNAMKVLHGEMDYNAPEAIAAINYMSPELQLGAKGGRQVSVKKIYPGQTPGTVMFGLNVKGDSKERPLTENRSTDDTDPVKEVSVDDLMGRVQTADEIRKMALSPQGRDWFINTKLGSEFETRQLQQQRLQQQLRDDNWSDIKTDEKSGVTYQENGNGKKIQLDARKGLNSSGKSAPPEVEKKFRFFKSRGYDDDTAMKMATSAVENRSTEVIRIAEMLKKDDSQLSGEEALKKAQKMHDENFGDDHQNVDNNPVMLPGVSTATPPVAIPLRQPVAAPQQALDHLKAHPDTAPFFKQKYGYLPDTTP